MVAIGSEVYRDLGDYETILPNWLDQPGVMAWLDVGERDQPRAFAVLGFYVEDEGRTVADLLAIAVAPPWQRRGLGRTMLGHVLQVVRNIAPTSGLDELRLTVASDNVVGQRMYRTAGFAEVDGDHGSYAGGQRAIRMRIGL